MGRLSLQIACARGLIQRRFSKSALVPILIRLCVCEWGVLCRLTLTVPRPAPQGEEGLLCAAV